MSGNNESKSWPNMSTEDKTALRDALLDTGHAFTKDELARIIDNEFFNDANPLDDDLVEAAIARMLLLDGVTLDEGTMQRERERMIYGVLKKIVRGDK